MRLRWLILLILLLAICGGITYMVWPRSGVAVFRDSFGKGIKAGWSPKTPEKWELDEEGFYRLKEGNGGVLVEVGHPYNPQLVPKVDKPGAGFLGEVMGSLAKSPDDLAGLDILTPFHPEGDVAVSADPIFHDRRVSPRRGRGERA